jgi:hypothetical protein
VTRELTEKLKARHELGVDELERTCHEVWRPVDDLADKIAASHAISLDGLAAMARFALLMLLFNNDDDPESWPPHALALHSLIEDARRLHAGGVANG